MDLPFEKWEGLGNDFVIVEAKSLDDEQVQRLCDRRRGIGADGVLLISGKPPRMTVRNADGSRPEMCGNGLRCVAGLLLQRSNEEHATFEVETDAGQKRCSARRLSPDSFEVEVSMATSPATNRASRDVEGRVFDGYEVDVGNPHFVIFDADLPQGSISVLGAALSAKSQAAGGDNVEFCWPEGAGFRVVVWERGVGLTDACGTGACAVAWAASQVDERLRNESQTISLPGGPLRITCRDDGEVLMVGPARRVFSGTVQL